MPADPAVRSEAILYLERRGNGRHADAMSRLRRLVLRTRMSWASDWRLLWRQSQNLGLAPSLLCLITWIGCGAAGARAVALALWQYPRLAWVFAMLIAMVVAIGGLVGFWFVLDLVDY